VAGTVYGSVLITDNAAIGKQVVSLSSTSVWPVVVAPASLNFGTQAVGTTSASQIVTLTNNQATALTLTSVTASGDYVVTTAGSSPCGNSVAALGQCTIGVQFSPSQAGTVAGALSVSHSASNSPLAVGLVGIGQ
jgi:GMP synthase-like glutamine amidotransferase